MLINVGKISEFSNVSCLLSLARHIQKIASFAWVECKILRKNQAGACRGCARNVRLQIGSQLQIH